MALCRPLPVKSSGVWTGIATDKIKAAFCHTTPRWTFTKKRKNTPARDRTENLLLRRQAPYPLGHGGFSRVGTHGVSGKVIVTCRLGNRVCAAGALDAYAACGNSDERAVADG